MIAATDGSLGGCSPNWRCGVKNSWTGVAGLAVLVLSLAACDDGARAGFDAGRAASSSTASKAPTASNVDTVIVTWQPRDKTAEFLSAWRPKH